MRILLDECVDETLRHRFTPHLCQTCRHAGFRGLTNGELIARSGAGRVRSVGHGRPEYAISAKREERAISVVVIRGRTTNIDDLLILMPGVLAALEVLKPGRVVRIGMH